MGVALRDYKTQTSSSPAVMRLHKVYHRFSLLSSLPSSALSLHHSVSAYKNHISLPIRSLSFHHSHNNSLKPITDNHFPGKPTKKMSTHSDFSALAAENVGPNGSAASPPTQAYEDDDGAFMCIYLCFVYVCCLICLILFKVLVV